MIDAYGTLHDLGLAHSAEAWRGGELVGGLYGVSLGGAFFGESMFANATDASKIAYLTQTTLSVDDASRIIEHLKQRFPDIKGPAKDDICYATQNRQEAVRKLAPKAEVVLVLGSQNSSNSQRLKELASDHGPPAYLVDGASDIDDSWFANVESVLITAGASAPESVVQECVSYLQQKYNAALELITIRQEEVHFPLPTELRGCVSETSLRATKSFNDAS